MEHSDRAQQTDLQGDEDVAEDVVSTAPVGKILNLPQVDTFSTNCAPFRRARKVRLFGRVHESYVHIGISRCVTSSSQTYPSL